MITAENTDLQSQKQMYASSLDMFGHIKWSIMRVLLSTLGRTSKGIRLGYTYGFDSGTMLDYVYRNQAHGSLGFGRLIDRSYLEAVGWRAIRARRVLLKQVLKQEVECKLVRGRPIRLLDVAAGPGRYLQELVQENDLGRDELLILCRDLSQDGLMQGARQAEEAGLQNICYEHGNAFEPAPTDAVLGGAPDIIVVSGLYELMLDDQLIQDSLARLYTLLAPGGMLCFTTQTHHPQLDFIANVLPNRDGRPWIMKCRAAEQLEGWACAVGFNDVHSQLEEVGLFAVTTARKL
jgi:2-polyprenyl-3-methyl-5-hydroxy-6-metoxy-1,4-benzoquinol methylase